MRPSIDGFGEWLYKFVRFDEYPLEVYLKGRKFTETDILALDECFTLFLGKSVTKAEIDNFKSFKELEALFYRDDIPQYADGGLKAFIEKEKRGLEFRHSLVGYRCEERFNVCSLKPELRDYTFCIYHSYGNTQIMVGKKGDSPEFIRLEWSRLFKAMHSFYSTKIEKKQLNLFDLAA